MPKYEFKCSCRAELVVEDSADAVLKVFESWQFQHDHGPINETKTKEALRAKAMQEAGKSLREIAAELGYSHAQSVKFLIGRYGYESTNRLNALEKGAEK